jgi:hypothetical protein
MGGAKNLAALGLKPMDDAIQIVVRRIFELTNEGERNLALSALLGKAWMTNVETLKLLAAQGYGPAIKQAKRMGLFFDDEAARQAHDFAVQIATLKANFEGLSTSFGRSVIPVVNSLTAALFNMQSSMRDSGVGVFRGMRQFVDRMVKTPFEAKAIHSGWARQTWPRYAIKKHQEVPMREVDWGRELHLAIDPFPPLPFFAGGEKFFPGYCGLRIHLFPMWDYGIRIGGSGNRAGDTLSSGTVDCHLRTRNGASFRSNAGEIRSER